MSYGFDTNTQETASNVPIGAGITENVFLNEVKFTAMSEGKDPVLQVGFKTKTGEILNESFWAVDEARVRGYTNDKPHKKDNPSLGFVKGAPITEDDAVKIAYDTFNTNLKHIATKFVSDEEAVINASSYNDLATKYVALLNKEEYKAIPLRLKVVLNNKDYSTLPRFAPFIERMDTVSAAQSRLRITQYDKIIPTTATSAPSDATGFNFGANAEPESVF